MKRRRKNRFSRRSGNKTNQHIKVYVVAILVLALIGACYLKVDACLRPVMSEVAQVKVKEMLSIAINDAVRDKMLKEGDEMEFLKIETDQSGDVSLISANSIYMNNFSSDLTEMIHIKINALTAEKVTLPIGSILGSAVFEQVGPEVDLKVKPLGMAKVDFKTEFVSSGINQTKYKVYLEISSKAKPLIPFASEAVELSTVVLIAETVVVGNVPQTYVSIPGGSDNILGAGSTNGMIGAGSVAGSVINGIDLDALE